MDLNRGRQRQAGRGRSRQAARQAGRQAGRQQAGRQAGSKQAGRQAEAEAGRGRQRQAEAGRQWQAGSGRQDACLTKTRAPAPPIRRVERNETGRDTAGAAVVPCRCPLGIGWSL
jgi:hypothetical protein